MLTLELVRKGAWSALTHPRKINGHFKVPLKTEVAMAAKDVLNITPYKASGISLFERIKIQEIKQLFLSLKDYLSLDCMWLISGLFTKDAPNWQGFMPDIIDGHFECSSFIINRMVPLNPETNEAICCTMRSVKEQTFKMGMCCAALMFNQPLYLKANKIKYNSSDEFNKLHMRLGVFHQLMAFLETSRKLLTGSGIEELWGTVYAKRSIPKMLVGKAYTKCLRSYLLTDAADTGHQYECANNLEEVTEAEIRMDGVESDENIFDKVEDWNAEFDFQDPDCDNQGVVQVVKTTMKAMS